MPNDLDCFFLFDGINSATIYDIYTLHIRRPLLPPAKTRKVEVPNRRGDWYYKSDLGSYVIEVDIFFNDDTQELVADKSRDIAAWLNPDEGLKRLIFFDEPDIYYNAVIQDQTAIEQLLEQRRTTLQFYVPEGTAYSTTNESINNVGSIVQMNGVTVGGKLFNAAITVNQSSAGADDVGEVSIIGSSAFFTAPTGATYTLTTPKAALTNFEGAGATGTVQLMFTGSDTSRFAAIVGATASKEIIVARFNAGNWEYNDDTTWNTFTTNSNDAIIGQLTRLDASSEGFDSFVKYYDEDLPANIDGITVGGVYNGVFYINRLEDGTYDEGEIGCNGSSLVFRHPNGRSFNVIAGKTIGTGAESTGYTGNGYIIFIASDTSRFTRSGGTGFAADFVFARNFGGQWQYDDGSAIDGTQWKPFTPNNNDCILQEVGRQSTSDPINTIRSYVTDALAVTAIEITEGSGTQLPIITIKLNSTPTIFSVTHVNTGRKIIIDNGSAMAVGDVLEFNSVNNTVKKNGTLIMDKVSIQSRFFEFPIGFNQISVSSAITAADSYVSYTPRWL